MDKILQGLAIVCGLIIGIFMMAVSFVLQLIPIAIGITIVVYVYKFFTGA